MVFDHFVADQAEADRLNKIGYQPWGQLIPGDAVYKDLDRNGVIDDEDRTTMGNPRSPELCSVFLLVSNIRISISVSCFKELPRLLFY